MTVVDLSGAMPKSQPGGTADAPFRTGSV